MRCFILHCRFYVGQRNMSGQVWAYGMCVPSHLKHGNWYTDIPCTWLCSLQHTYICVLHVVPLILILSDVGNRVWNNKLWYGDNLHSYTPSTHKVSIRIWGEYYFVYCRCVYAMLGQCFNENQQALTRYNSLYMYITGLARAYLKPVHYYVNVHVHVHFCNIRIHSTLCTHTHV